MRLVLKSERWEIDIDEEFRVEPLLTRPRIVNAEVSEIWVNSGKQGNV